VVPATATVTEDHKRAGMSAEGLVQHIYRRPLLQCLMLDGEMYLSSHHLVQRRRPGTVACATSASPVQISMIVWARVHPLAISFLFKFGRGAVWLTLRMRLYRMFACRCGTLWSNLHCPCLKKK